jgi:ATP-dependent DNA helicase RecQ
MARHLAARGVASAAVATTAARLAARTQATDVDELAAAVGLGSRSATLALARLVDVGAASWQADGRIRWRGAQSVSDAIEASDDETSREHEVERSRLEMMRRSAGHTGCRRSFLLTYFGQDYPGPCGACDNDRSRSAAEHGIEPFAVGARVASQRWGEGTVPRYDGDQLTVLFDDHGYRDLLVPVILKRGLLRQV